jgi:3-hydroxy acid dehydrogenase/malonic semialdehyde reductase
VLLTGASSGIGASTATLFARAGANLVLLARRKDALNATAEKCKQELAAGGYDGKVLTIEADMRDRKGLDDILSKTGGLAIDM